MAKSASRGFAGKSPMTATAAARIQSATAKTNGGMVQKGSFAARATRAAGKAGQK